MSPHNHTDEVVYGRRNRGLARSAAVPDVFGERMDSAAPTSARTRDPLAGMELYELSAPMGSHDRRRGLARTKQRTGGDRADLIRDIAELREALEQLRVAVIRWRSLYEESSSRCAALEATVAKLTRPQ